MSAQLKAAPRVESIPKIDLLGHLLHAKIYPKFYYSARDGSRSFVALGKIATVAENELLEDGVRAVGAFTFEATHLGEALYIPEYIIEEKNGAFTLTCFTEKGVCLKSCQAQSAKKATLLNTIHFPDRETWNNRVKNSPLEKIVMGRKTVQTYSSAINPYNLIQRLKKSISPKKNSATLFFYENQPGSVFLGASPEMLFSLTQQSFESESLAATLPLKSERNWSDKERREFELVKRYIEETLLPLTEEQKWSGSDSVKTSAAVKHLYNKISGTIKSDTSAWDLLRALHPTPAMAGIPKKAAKGYIHSSETRGFFTAPIGWMENGRAEFAAAIRCATIKGCEVSLHAAAGILADSDPDSEWEELDIKMETIGKWLN